MNSTRYLLSIFLSLLLVPTYGQNFKFSEEITVSNDEKIQAIAEVWSTYLNSFHDKSVDRDSVYKALWHESSPYNLLEYCTGANIYTRVRNHFTFNIRKRVDDYYEIHTLLPYTLSDGKESILNIYKVCAKEYNGEFKLVNYFDVTKHQLNYAEVDFIDFYSPPSINLEQSGIQKAVELVQEFKATYNIQDDRKILYIVGNSMDECWTLLGVPYTLYRSEKYYSGYTMRPNIILTTTPDHIHELVHAILIPLYPTAHSLLHEGIATYYGGMAQKEYSSHILHLKDHLRNNYMDFTNYNTLNSEIENENVILYTVGALVIEYTLTNYGHDKVLQLFNHTELEGIFKELGVEKDHINNWLHTLIKQYEKPATKNTF